MSPDATPVDPEKIRKLRKKLDITQTKFGELVGVTWRTVAGWEAGTSNCSGSAAILVRQMLVEHLDD